MENFSDVVWHCSNLRKLSWEMIARGVKDHRKLDTDRLNRVNALIVKVEKELQPDGWDYINEKII